jgi:hypothetical protein
VTLQGTVPVTNYSGEWESGDDSPEPNGTNGNVSVAIAFDLNGTGSTNPWTITYSLNVSGWPWLNTSDALGVEVRSNLSTASGRWVLGGGHSLTAESASTHARLASFTWGVLARAVYSGGGEEDSNVGSYHNFSTNGASSLVRLEFGAVSGGYSALSYDPWLGIVPVHLSVGSLAAWVLTPGSWAVLGAGGAGTILLAVWTRSRRTPPESGL